MEDKTNMAERERVTFSKFYDFDCQNSIKTYTNYVWNYLNLFFYFYL